MSRINQRLSDDRPGGRNLAHKKGEIQPIADNRWTIDRVLRDPHGVTIRLIDVEPAHLKFVIQIAVDGVRTHAEDFDLPGTDHGRL